MREKPGMRQSWRRRVVIRFALASVAACWAAFGSPLGAQEVLDSAFVPQPVQATWSVGAGPWVAIDESHNNGETLDGGLTPLGEVLGADGYRLRPLQHGIRPGDLDGVGVLVIVDALADRNVDNWTLPTPSAFDEPTRHTIVTWVEDGGALLLVADHMPFPGATSDLARSLGLELLNGFAIDTVSWDPIVFRRSDGTVGRHPILDGRTASERVDSVYTYWGHAFRAEGDGTPLLTFAPGIVSYQPREAWRFVEGTEIENVGGWAEGMALRVGRGRVVVLGDSGMLSAHLVGPNRQPVGMNAPQGRQNQQFMLNVFHWLSGLLPPGPG